MEIVVILLVIVWAMTVAIYQRKVKHLEERLHSKTVELDIIWKVHKETLDRFPKPTAPAWPTVGTTFSAYTGIYRGSQYGD